MDHDGRRQFADDLRNFKRHKGGYSSRVTADSVGERAWPTICPIHDLLLEEWAFGTLSATQVQTYSLSMWNSGLTSPFIEKLASFGKWGKFEGNVHQELMRYVKKLTPLMEPEVFDCPIKIEKGPDRGLKTVPIHWCPPHMWLNHCMNIIQPILLPNCAVQKIQFAISGMESNQTIPN